MGGPIHKKNKICDCVGFFGFWRKLFRIDRFAKGKICVLGPASNFVFLRLASFGSILNIFHILLRGRLGLHHGALTHFGLSRHDRPSLPKVSSWGSQFIQNM